MAGAAPAMTVGRVLLAGTGPPAFVLRSRCGPARVAFEVVDKLSEHVEMVAWLVGVAVPGVSIGISSFKLCEKFPGAEFHARLMLRRIERRQARALHKAILAEETSEYRNKFDHAGVSSLRFTNSEVALCEKLFWAVCSHRRCWFPRLPKLTRRQRRPRRLSRPRQQP